MIKLNRQELSQRLATYKKHPLSFVFLIIVCLSTLITVGVFLFVVGYVIITGVPNLRPELFSPVYNSENSSMLPSIVSTLEIVGISLLIAAPLGVFCAIYLVEYAKRGNRLVKIIRVTTETLSGIPSIVYGLFGSLFFVSSQGMGLGMGISIISGSLTISIMILPLIIRSTEEALKAVNDSYREGSFGLGAGKLRTVFRIVLPSAGNGILAGIILAIGRIIGETAALIYTAGTVAKIPENIFSSGRTLSLHMYILSGEGLKMSEASATGVVILITVFALNGLASFIAKKLTKE